MMATRRDTVELQGQHGRAAVAGTLRSSTMPSAAVRRTSAMSAASWRVVSGPGPSASSAPVRSISSSTLRARARTSSTDTSPRSIASSSICPRCSVGPGISRSSPAFTPSAVLCRPNQSLITRPSKPHSPRSTSASSAVGRPRAVDAVVRRHHRHRLPHRAPRPRTDAGTPRAACARRSANRCCCARTRCRCRRSA